MTPMLMGSMSSKRLSGTRPEMDNFYVKSEISWNYLHICLFCFEFECKQKLRDNQFQSLLYWYFVVRLRENLAFFEIFCFFQTFAIDSHLATSQFHTTTKVDSETARFPLFERHFSSSPRLYLIFQNWKDIIAHIHQRKYGSQSYGISSHNVKGKTFKTSNRNPDTFSASMTFSTSFDGWNL